MSNLNKYKKNELVDLAEKMNLDTAGIKSDLEARISDYVEKHGGWEEVAASGKLKDPSWLKQLDIKVKAVADKVVQPVKKASTKAATKVQHAVHDSHLDSFYKSHSPMPLLNTLFGHLDTHFNVKQYFTELRSKFTSADTVVLLLVYLEFGWLVYSQIGWNVKPIFTVPLPNALHGVFHKDFVAFNFNLPILSGLLNRKQFWYPAFYWFVYFVAIPTVLGWVINLSSRAGKVICPVNMLTFSWVRLMIFWWCIVSAVNVDGLLTGIPVTMYHKSLTVLFDGAHLPIKMFLTSCLSGLVYALYEKHDE